MKVLLAIAALCAVLAPAAHANPARDITQAGAPGAVVLDRDGVHAAGNVRPDTRFRVGSVTKTFVATVVMQLVAEGRLSLDEPVPEARGVPLRTLLNHTSGLFNHSDDPRVFEHGLLTQWDPRELLKISLEHDPYFPPGTGFHYANTNYVVLGLVVERVTGRPLADELRRRVLRPLRLRDTSYDASPDVPRLAPGPRQNTSWAGAAGALASTARDLARFYRAIPLAPLQVLEPVAGNYGRGLFRIDTSCGPAWGHDGAVPGYLAQAFVRGARPVVVLVDQQPLSERAAAAVGRAIDRGLCS